MKKEDFKFHVSGYYIENADYVLGINMNQFDDDSIKYAENIINKYLQEKDKILDEILDKGLRDYYSTYDDQFIKDNIGRPQIKISFRNEKENADFKYAGMIDFLENKIDSHNISLDFKDDLSFGTDIIIN